MNLTQIAILFSVGLVVGAVGAVVTSLGFIIAWNFFGWMPDVWCEEKVALTAHECVQEFPETDREKAKEYARRVIERYVKNFSDRT